MREILDAIRLAEEIADPNFIEKYAALKRENQALSHMVRQFGNQQEASVLTASRLTDQIRVLLNHNEKLRNMIREVRGAINVPDGPGV